jgi:hypothetical protein
MKRASIGLIVAALAVVVSAGTAAAAAPSPVIDPAPIGPHQTFYGAVNGRMASASIVVVGCSNTTGSGHPASGQTVVVLPLAPSVAVRGFTGKAHQVAVDLEVPVSDPMLPLIYVVHLGTISTYAIQLPIPTNISLPCRGSATAVFSPIKGGRKAVNSRVPVTFVTPTAVSVPPMATAAKAA